MNPAEASPPRHSKARGLVGGLVLLLGTSIVCILLLEGAVRMFFPFFSPGTQVPFHVNADGVALGPAGQSVRQATPKGDYDTTVRFNSDGFRDSKELRTATPADWYALGDSFTMGWGVDEDQRYSNRLEQALKGSGLSCAVYNIAIPENIIGYGRLLKYAETRGAKVHHLIVGVCMENDLQDYRAGKSDWDPVQEARLKALPAKERLRSWMRWHSALYNAVSFAVQKSGAARHALEKAGVARNADQLSHTNTEDDVILQSSRDALVNVVKGYDALVLIIPSRRLWHGDNTAVENRVHERFVKSLRDANLRVVDLRVALERGGKPLDYYFVSDPHWNTKGHALAAQELFQAIVAKNSHTSSETPSAALLATPPTSP